MFSRARLVLLLGAALGATAARGDETSRGRLTDEIAKVRLELREAEEQLEEVKRLVPADAASEVQAFLHRAAARAELPSPVVASAAKSEAVVHDGRATGISLHRTLVSGRSAYAPLHLFLSMLAFGPRPMDVESLDLKAAPEGTVSYRVALVSPSFTGREDAPLPPLRPRAAGGSPAEAAEAARDAVLQRELDHLRARKDASRALVASVLEHTERRRNPRLGHALGLLARALERKAVALESVDAGPTIVLRGVTFGAPALAAVREALGGAGFAVDDLTTSAAGRCQRFVATVRLVAGDPPFESVPGNGLFDDQPESVCSAAPPAPLPRVTAQGRGAGPLTLQMQDADVAELFATLHEATSESFVLDADLEGQVTVDVEHATLEETLAALAGAGLRVSPGPLRRVSFTRTATPARLGERYTGDPVSVSLRHAALVDILRLLEEITGLPILVARGLDRKVGVFAREQPWDLVLDSVVAASGLSRDIADGRLYVGPQTALQAPGRPGFVSVTEASTSGSRREWWTFSEGR